MENKTNKILVVEDERAQREALEKKLSREGFHVFVATNGEEGLKLAQQMEPDLILLDIVMPHMDGVTMLKKLRDDPWGKGARVIMLTNLSEAHVEIDRDSVTDLLVKAEWSMTELAARVKEVLG